MNQKYIPYIIASGILIVLFAAGIFLIHMPLSQKIQERRTEFAGKESELKLVQQKVRELMKLRSEYEALQAQAKKLEESIPDNPNVPSVISMMEKYATESNVIVVNVTFIDAQPISAAPGTPADPNAAATPQAAAGDIDIRNCVISVQGRYSSIIEFFTVLKNSPRLFGIKKVTFNPVKEDGKDVKADIELVYFNYKTRTASNNPSPAPN